MIMGVLCIMDIFNCIFGRRSIRKFRTEPVEWLKVGRLLEAGLAAPTAGNLHDVRFLVVTDDDKRREIAHYCMDQLWMASAPIFIVVNSTFQKTQRFYGVRGERLYSVQSAAAAAQNILLAAHELGLGACWVGAFDEDSISDVLGIPGHTRVQAVIPVGYADEMPPMPPKAHLHEMVHFNRFGDNSAKVLDIRKDVLKEWSPYCEDIVNGCKDLASSGAKACVEGSQSLGDKLKGHAKKLHEHIKDKVNPKKE